MKPEDCAYLIGDDESCVIILYNVEALGKLKNKSFYFFGGALQDRGDVR